MSPLQIPPPSIPKSIQITLSLIPVVSPGRRRERVTSAGAVALKHTEDGQKWHLQEPNSLFITCTFYMPTLQMDQLFYENEAWHVVWWCHWGQMKWANLFFYVYNEFQEAEIKDFIGWVCVEAVKSSFLQRGRWTGRSTNQKTDELICFLITKMFVGFDLRNFSSAFF